MPEPKTATSKNDALDIQAVVEHLTAANRTVGKDYVDLVEKTVAQVTDLQLETATALKLPIVTNLVETQVDLTRQIADTYVKTARELLNA